MADKTLTQSLNHRHLREIAIGHIASVAERRWLRVANRSAATAEDPDADIPSGSTASWKSPSIPR